jgi:CubicO group peptidase (beta-lactamase class C family)
MRTVIVLCLIPLAASMGIAQELLPIPHRLRSINDDPKRHVFAPTSPAHVNLSSSLDSFIVAQMNSQHVAGLAACIVKSGRVVWNGNYGFADIARNKPVTDSTIFMLASISKTVTATALMQLYEAGRFQLDDSVNGHLPFAVRNPNFPSVPITFRMLLTHRSSIQDRSARI